MSQDFDAKLLAVRDAISKRPPFISGTLDVPDVDLKLYFGDQHVSDCIYLGQSTEEKLASLVATCKPATFGLNQQDVLDETYRKAVTLDNTMFASLLKPAGYGLINTIRDQLLQEGAESTKQIVHEVYRLNVYEQGSFFKPHKDTPRSERMFGSLVIIFPTPHEGGALILREDGREWTFDYAAELAKSSSKIAYIAFFGDIEHEVLPVTSGHRITLTYNLYFEGLPSGGARPDALPAIPRSVEDQDARLRGALQTFLQDPKLLPEGGYLAFGLRFMYPLQRDKKANLQDLLPHLKGGDAMVVRVCQSLGIVGKLMLVYKDDQIYEDMLAHYYNTDHSSEDDRDDDTDGESETYWMDYYRPREAHVCVAVNHFTKIDAVEDTTFSRELVDNEGGERIRSMGSKPLTREYWSRVGRPAPVIPSTEAFWVTQLASLNSVKQTYMAYGNQSDMRHTYGYLAYFVKVDRDAQGDSTA
ncbi:uncharacterized protein SCHCODRAFT_02686773 [Schizophyllum commune H4-8]|uniref:Fe2OG dioxygenase domain-containing protein n=1 Tax=Schizophyllum commune (strain H4-8 / FGSC 9210) TaxID=578458 RepID=D8Q1D8_SCHCM|nr:uncharacterized protein SCHCODRAFT_02686773 [Schizophyllum commune H4-8]KAI5895377.1 hypothetical protein SCHCODRAFT_02686773 [Schizophyllum commune H4-8]